VKGLSRRRWLTGAAALAAWPAFASRPAIAAQRARLPDTQQFDLDAPGGAYRIQVLTPRRKPRRAAGHPVLYLLDGNAFFGAYYDAARLQDDLAGDAIVVAVGYPSDGPFDFLRRSYDFSPPLPPGTVAPAGQPPLGGELALHAFLADVLLPDIATRFPVDTRRQILLGHSFGGMYALAMLYARPALFGQIVAISPSIWWQDHYLLAREREFVARARAAEFSLSNKRLLLIAGGAESPQTIQETRSLAQRLDTALSGHGLGVDYAELPGETHMSVPVAAATTVLRHVLTARWS